MDLIVAACRALANRHRLELLRAIHEQPGLTIQPLAEQTKLALPVVSRHLKLLRELHLVQMTPRGRHVHCAPPRPGSTSSRFLTDLQKLLRWVLGGGDLNSTLSKVCNSDRPGHAGWPAVYAALIAQFTTFTHLRRLLILRWLAQRPAGRPDELAAAIRMSPPAASRHLDKLRRRGVVQATGGPAGGWALRDGTGPPAQRRLLAIVLRGLGTG
jgi:DNA-binding transcriptional ArsR family regulator